jgi:DNA-binding SARP family transcriptional activator
MARFRLIGELTISSGERVVTPRGPKIGKILAVLLLSANRPVHVDVLAEELWGEAQPKLPEATLRTHIYHLRRALGPLGISSLLLTRPSGYLIRLTGEHELDVWSFERGAARGHALLDAGELASGAAALRSALRLSEDRFLATVHCGPVLQRQVVRLEHTRSKARELCIEAEMRLGRHRELIAELRELAAADPLDEWCHAHLVRALFHSGHRFEALRVYRGLRHRLNEQLGLEPSVELKRLQDELLTADAEVA